MAEPTMSDLADLIRKLDTSLNAKIDGVQQQVTGVQARVDGIQARVDGLHSTSSSASSGSSPGAGASTDRPPRFQKMDFPKFDGKSDPLIFINRCESFFHQQRIVEEEKVWMASYNLDDAAQLWYIQVQRDEGTPSWRRFSELLNLRFGPPLRANPLGELAACKRTGSVLDYQERFEARLQRAGQLSESQKVQLFTAGLQPPLSLDVEIHNPQSLAVAMSLARKLELRDQCAAPQGAALRPPQRGLLPTPVKPLALTAPPPRAPAPADGRQIKRLSQAEMEERRRLGLCFNCNDKFGRGHNRVCQRLFLVDLAEDEEEETPGDHTTSVTDAPTISVLAISGVHTKETMQLEIAIDGVSFLALLDSGSTHNFITEEAGRRTSLRLHPQQGMRVTVTNGDRVASPGVYRATPFAIAGEHFTADFFALPLAGYDVVLGTRRLASLGPILWDFRTLRMAFTHGGRPVCW
jgi:hypothetical protein